MMAPAEEPEDGAGGEAEELGDLAGPLPPGPIGGGGEREEGDLVGPTSPPPAKRRKVCPLCALAPPHQQVQGNDAAPECGGEPCGFGIDWSRCCHDHTWLWQEGATMQSWSCGARQHILMQLLSVH